MRMYDILYLCPQCQSEHNAQEWNETTEETYGAGILPIEQGWPEHFYVCPTCQEVVNSEDISDL